MQGVLQGLREAEREQEAEMMSIVGTPIRVTVGPSPLDSKFCPRRAFGTSAIRIQSYQHLIALESDAALSAAWARRAGMVSYFSRSPRVLWCIAVSARH